MDEHTRSFLFSAERELVASMEVAGGMEEQPGAGVELVGFNSMEQLMDEDWISDARSANFCLL